MSEEAEGWTWFKLLPWTPQRKHFRKYVILRIEKTTLPSTIEGKDLQERVNVLSKASIVKEDNSENSSSRLLKTSLIKLGFSFLKWSWRGRQWRGDDGEGFLNKSTPFCLIRRTVTHATKVELSQVSGEAAIIL